MQPFATARQEFATPTNETLAPSLPPEPAMDGTLSPEINPEINHAYGRLMQALERLQENVYRSALASAETSSDYAAPADEEHAGEIHHLTLRCQELKTENQRLSDQLRQMEAKYLQLYSTAQQINQKLGGSIDTLESILTNRQGN
jgi:methyl-accepting chemotaxis protein